jgi:hypothetical protein
VYPLKWFLESLQSDDRFRELSLSQLVEFQMNAEKKDQYLLLERLQEAIGSREGTYNGKRTYSSVVEMFFESSWASLPAAVKGIGGTRESVQGKLTPEIIRQLVNAADLDFQAVYLTYWMGILDTARFQYFNERYGGELAEHLQTKGVDEPFRMEFPGRKKNLNKVQYHTFIGHDALAAWRNYFERIRGYPKKDEPIIKGKDGPITENGIRARHTRTLEKLNYIKTGGGTTGNRYGYGLHEFRDVARTLLHLEGKGDGLDLEYVEHWMGHTTDPNGYDKFYMDKAKALKQYRIAEKHLNIVSGSALGPQLQNADEMIEAIVRNKVAMQKLADVLEKSIGARLTPVEKEDPGHASQA